MNGILFAAFLAALLALVNTTTSAAHHSPIYPVLYGGEPDYDACFGTATVGGLRADGDGFLAVRTGPGVGYPMIDKLINGQPVSLCWATDDVDWYGVVYTREDKDCGTGSNIPLVQAYPGPCLSGWVHRNWLRSFAD